MYQVAIAVKQITPKYSGFRQWHLFTISPCLCVRNLGVAELGASSADSQITVCVSETRGWPSWGVLAWGLRSRCLCVRDPVVAELEGSSADSQITVSVCLGPGVADLGVPAQGLRSGRRQASCLI